MKIRKYENLMLEIEKLSKNREENAEKLAALSSQLKAQKVVIDRVSVSKIKEKLRSENLSFKEYCNLKDLLIEKKAYQKNEEKINAVISGEYENVKQKSVMVFRRFAKTAAAVGLAALLAFGLKSCNKNNKKSVKTNPTVTEQTISGSDDSDNKENTRTSEIDTKSKNEESKEKSEKEEKNTNKDNKESEELKDNKEEESYKKENIISSKPSDSINVVSNGTNSEQTGYSGEAVETIMPEKTIPVNTEGKLPIEPHTEVINPDNNDGKKDTYNEEPAPTNTPSLDRVDGNDEIKHDIPEGKTGEKEYDGKDSKKENTHSEEPAPTNTPSLDKVDGNDEKEYDIPEGKDGEKPYDGKEEEKHDTYEEEPAPTNLPSLDNVEDSEGIIINEINETNTCQEEKAMEIKKDEDKVVNKVEDKKDTTVVIKEENSTPSLDNVEDSEGIVVNEIKDSNIQLGEEVSGKWIDVEDTFVEEVAPTVLPSLDNVDDSNYIEEEESNVNGYNVTLGTYTYTVKSRTI